MVLASGFINAVIVQFLIVAFTIFLVVKGDQPVVKAEPPPPTRHAGGHPAAARDPRHAAQVTPTSAHPALEAAGRTLAASSFPGPTDAPRPRLPAAASPCRPVRAKLRASHDSAMAQTANTHPGAADDTGWRVLESLTTRSRPAPGTGSRPMPALRWHGREGKIPGIGYDKVLDRWCEPEVGRRAESRALMLGAHARRRCTSPRSRHQTARSRPRSCASRPGALQQATELAHQQSPSSTTDGAQATAAAGPGSQICWQRPSAAIPRRRDRLPDALGRHRSHRNPHTGITRFDEGLAPIPSAALSAPDADQLARTAGGARPDQSRWRSTAAGTARTPRRT